jgi:dTDP-4-amino-4,6-dideoxygalactose transaminase
MIQISAPNISDEIEQAVLETLRSGQLAQGPRVAEFESLVAAMAGTSHAVAMSNGTATLEAIFTGLGIGPGDEVITTPFTFVATVNAIIGCGATVRFADIADDFNIDAEAVAAMVNDRTAAICGVHLYGLPFDAYAMQALCARHALVLVEDAAQAHGAELRGRRVGGFGPASFSFYATKNISCGEGGAVTTNDEALARFLRTYRNQGMVERYVYEMAGRNLRMTDLQAAIGIPQLRRLSSINSARAANAAAYSDALGERGHLRAPVTYQDRTHAWHQYTLLSDSPAEREHLAQVLAERSIGSGRYYPKVIYDYDAYRNHPQVVIDRCPKAEQFADRCLSIPVHDRLSESDRAQVCDALSSFVPVVR